MGWMSDLLRVFGLQFITEAKVEEVEILKTSSKEDEITSKILLPEKSQELLKKIENEEIKTLGERVLCLALNVNNLCVINRQQQELLINIATMHEEMLYLLDQGKIVMMRTAPPEGAQQQQSKEDSDDPMNILHKKKEHLN